MLKSDSFYSPELVQSHQITVARPLAPDREILQQGIDHIVAKSWYSNFGGLHERLKVALQGELDCESLLLFNNGSQALTTALRALDVRGEAITTPFTFPATPHCIEWAGAIPIFADIDPRYMTLDPEAVEAAITPRTEAIVAVHVYGIACDVDALQTIATKHGLALIYDAAHAFGVRVGDRPIHSYGDATMFSFHPTKLFHTGEGGGLVLRDRKVEANAILQRNFGIRDEVTVELAGSNGKMNEMQAAMGLAVLPCVADERKARRKLVEHYRNELSDCLEVHIPPNRAHVSDSLQYFPVRFQSREIRDLAYDVLRVHNILARRYFYPLCSAARHYASRWSAEAFPVATRCSDEVLCLPMHSGVTNEASFAITRLLKQVASVALEAA
ncbi:MAG: DegT/DnrJ/EryC1/StrS family aminotransferase [Casimicrobium sp.]